MGVPALKALYGPCSLLVPTLTADQTRLQEPFEASAATEGSRV